MKKVLVIFLAVFSILMNAQTDPNLKWIQPTPQGWDLKWIKMWDANNWYLSGDYGAFMKTTDAGQTWVIKNNAGWPRTEYPAGINSFWHANAAWFFDQNNGIVVGSNTCGIVKTTNGGESFDALTIIPGSNSGKHLYNIYFVNSNLGFICGTSAWKIYKTTDGGNTWNQLPNLPDVTFNDVYATDELNIIACGSAGNIYKTSDGGANWDIISAGTTFNLMDLECINLTTWYVAGQGGFFGYTTNSGLNWSGTNVPSNYISAKLVVDGGNVYYASHPTDLYKSTDNGTTWSTITMTVPGLYTGLNYCADIYGSTLIVAGRYSNIYTSTNSGINWVNPLMKVTDGGFFQSIYVQNSTGKIIAAGRFGDFPGSIIYSDNGGITWQASPYITPFDYMLNRMQMFDNNRGYFAGDNGFFAQTADGGITLTPISIPFAGINKLYNMDFINQSTGWVTGGLPIIGGTSIVARTTDGGLTWTNQTPTGIAGVVLSIDMVDANVGYIGHVNLYKTTNGGTNWNTVTVPGLSPGGVRSIKAFDANNVYILSVDAQLFKTTNGGVNWQQVLTVPFGTVLSFGQEWYDMSNGILFGTLGTIAKTTDAGQTWQTMNTGGWTVGGAKMVSPDTFYVGSTQYGQIHRFAQPSTQTTFQLSVNVNNGWNMVSIPGLNSPDQNVNTWWAYRDQSANVFKYTGGYQPVTTVTPGTGYWMKHSGARTYNTGDEWPAGGIQIVSHDAIAGLTGWNLIGGYELSVSAAGVTTNPPGLQSGPIYLYSNGYQVATTIDPGYGYWMKLTGAGQITIPEAFSKENESADYFSDDWGRIIFTDARGLSYTLYAVNGEVNLDQFELPPAPMTGMFDIRFSSGRIAEDLNEAKTIEMNSLEHPVKVRVENVNLKLQEESAKGTISMLKSGEELTISDNTINKLTVISEEVISPVEYSLEQNYPNPFNPSTTIKFSLPEATDVSLVIYNTLGQKVTELVNGKLEAGRYSYHWNASDVSTGMYIYELRAENFVSVKKMILLK